MHELITVSCSKKWQRNEKPLIRRGLWLVPAPRLFPGSFWEAANQRGPKLSQGPLQWFNDIDNCKAGVPRHVPFWFTGSDLTVRHHREYYYFLDIWYHHWDGCHSSVHLCCHLCPPEPCGICKGSISTSGTWLSAAGGGHGGCTAGRLPCHGPGARAAWQREQLWSLPWSHQQLCSGTIWRSSQFAVM